MFRTKSKDEILKIVSLDGNQIQNCYKGQKNDIDIIKAAVYQNPKAITYVKKEYYSNKEIMTMKCSVVPKEVADFPQEQQLSYLAFDLNKFSFKFLNDDIKNDKKFVLEAIKKSPDVFKDLKLLKDDKDIIKAVLKVNPSYIRYLDKKCYSDKEIMKRNDVLDLNDINIQVLRADPSNFVYLSDEIKNDKEFVLFALKMNSIIFQYLDKNSEFYKDREITMLVLKSNYFLFEKCYEPFKNDPEIASIACGINSHYLRFCSSELKNNVEFMRKYILKDFNSAYKIAGEKVQTDKSLILELAKMKVNIPQNILEYFYNDDQVAYEIIKYDTLQIQRFDPKHKKNKNLLIDVIKTFEKPSYNAIFFYFDGSLKTDKEICLQFLSKKTHFVYYFDFPQEMKNDKEIIYESVRVSPSSYSLMTFDQRNDKDLVQLLLKSVHGSNDNITEILSYIPEEFHDLEGIETLIRASTRNILYCKSKIRQDRELLKYCLSQQWMINYLPEIWEDEELILISFKKFYSKYECIYGKLLTDEVFLERLCFEVPDFLFHIKRNYLKAFRYKTLLNSKRICIQTFKYNKQYFDIFPKDIRESFEVYIGCKGMYLLFFHSSIKNLYNCHFSFQQNVSVCSETFKNK